MTITATEAKNRLGEYIERAMKGEPVIIERNGRPVSVLLSAEEYERLERLDDAYWVAKAREGEKSGYLTPEETMDALRRLSERADAEVAAEQSAA